jgi:hypothetical protein
MRIAKKVLEFGLKTATVMIEQHLWRTNLPHRCQYAKAGTTKCKERETQDTGTEAERQFVRKMCKGNEYMTNSKLLKQGNALLARKLLQGVWSCASGITDVADKSLTKPSWRLSREAAIGIVEFVGA